MGMRKKLIKHGFGGIGDSVRTILNVYKDVKKTLPEIEEEAAFFLTLKLRREHVKRLIKPEYQYFLATEQMKKDAKAAQRRLVDLIFQELHYEYPILFEIETNDPSLYREAREIVEELVKEDS